MILQSEAPYQIFSRGTDSCLVDAAAIVDGSRTNAHIANGATEA